MFKKLANNNNRPDKERIEQLMKSTRQSGSSEYTWRDMGLLFTLSVLFHRDTAAFDWTLCRNAGDDVKLIYEEQSNDALVILGGMTKVVWDEINAEKEFQQTTFAVVPTLAKLDELRKTEELSQVSKMGRQTLFSLPNTEALRRPKSFSGTLDLVHITNLLQSIAMEKESGRLRVQRQADWSDIFFENGQPVHAQGSRGSGKECLLLTICWKDGDFQFESGLKTDEHTIQEELSRLLMQGVLLLDHTEYLRNAGLQMTIIPQKTYGFLTEQEFEAAVSKEGGIDDMTIAKKIYLAIDGSRNMGEILQQLDIPRSEWVPSVACLLRTKLVSMQEKVIQGQLTVVPKSIEKEVDMVRQALVKKETGMLTYPAFLYLLDHEMSLSQTTISVAIFLFDTTQPVPLSQFTEIDNIVASLHDFRGMVGHYSPQAVAIALYGMTTSQASVILNRVVQMIFDSDQDFVGREALRVGVASIPEDVFNVPCVLTAAELATKKAKETGRRLVLAKELSNMRSV